MEVDEVARAIFEIGGKDNKEFMQSLITNDVSKVDDGLVYSALLGPQGKFLYDFFLFSRGQALFLDVTTTLAEELCSRLSLYKLRKDVTIEETDLSMTRGLDAQPEGAFADPRHPDLGWRFYGPQIATQNVDWTKLRVKLGIPEATSEILTDSYILEMGFERLNGVDFRKGCYIGQEITARMKHKTRLRKGLALVKLSNPIPLHTLIMSNGKNIGFICSQSGNNAIAYLKYDRISDKMSAGKAEITDVNTEIITVKG
ncbi:MAG: folate-binding protein [Paracoccaceae bacterium]|nr:folate-binding protein [Paracoccaceae bacterium]